MEKRLGSDRLDGEPPGDGDHVLRRSAPQPELVKNPRLGLWGRSLLPLWISQKLTVSRARLKILQAPPQGQRRWLQNSAQQHQSAGPTGALQEDGKRTAPPTARGNLHLEGLLAALAVLGHLCLFKLLPFLLFPVAVAIVTGGAGGGVAVKPVEDSPPPAQDRTASPKTPAPTAEMEQGCGAPSSLYMPRPPGRHLAVAAASLSNPSVRSERRRSGPQWLSWVTT